MTPEQEDFSRRLREIVTPEDIGTWDNSQEMQIVVNKIYDDEDEDEVKYPVVMFIAQSFWNQYWLKSDDLAFFVWNVNKQTVDEARLFKTDEKRHRLPIDPAVVEQLTQLAKDIAKRYKKINWWFHPNDLVVEGGSYDAVSKKWTINYQGKTHELHPHYDWSRLDSKELEFIYNMLYMGRNGEGESSEVADELYCGLRTYGKDHQISF